MVNRNINWENVCCDFDHNMVLDGLAGVFQKLLVSFSHFYTEQSFELTTTKEKNNNNKNSGSVIASSVGGKQLC